METAGYVYILTNKPFGTLYIGVTSELSQRMVQHRSGEVRGFTKDYNCTRLVWCERFGSIHEAREHERRMKAWNRAWKVARIVERNPQWRDLFEDGLIP